MPQITTTPPQPTAAHYAHLLGPPITIFRFPVSWQVRNAVDGHIVQRIQRNEKYWARDVVGHPGETYQVINEDDYWECWEVRAGAFGAAPTITPSIAGIHDVFTVTRHLTHYESDGTARQYPDKQGGRGRWKIRGTVYFVAAGGLALGPQVGGEAVAGGAPRGWFRYMDDNGTVLNEPGCVRSAGRLLSRWTTPLPGNGLNLTGALGTPVLKREIAGTWDWSDEVPHPNRAMPRPNPPFNPPSSRSRRYPWRGNFASRRRMHLVDEVTWVPLAKMGAA
jgi:hypothetical protein